MNLFTYIIETREHETDCDTCGYPLVIGDTAYFNEQTSEVYCGKGCAVKAQPVLILVKPYQDLL